MSTHARLFRKLTRKIVTLPAATQAAREAGDIGPEDEVTVTIAKVSVGAVTARVGAPASIRERLRGEDPEETPEQRRERITREIQENPERVREMLEYQENLTRAIVCLGVMSEKVVDKHESELEDEEITPEHFGEDLPVVYNAILSFSDLPFLPSEVRDAARFRPEQVAQPVLADGEGAGHGPVDDQPGVEPGPV